MIFDRAAKLRIVQHSDLIFLNPNQSLQYDAVYSDLGSGEPRIDTVIDGQVILTLPSARKVRKLQVELIGRQNLFVGGQYETAETLHQTVEVDIGTQMLGPGDHVYAFSFVVPSTTAQYERCQYGRTYHKVIATAFAVGKMGSDLTAEDKVGLIANLSENGGVPPGFSMETETFHNVLGPVGINLYSKYLLVAGYLRLRLILPSVDQPVRIEDIKVNLLQTFGLQSWKDKGVSERKTVTVPLCTLRGKEPLGTLKQGEEFQITHQFRLSDDDKIRSSTSPNTLTGIRVAHRLAVLVHFTPLLNNPNRETKEIKIETDATLSSCCCMLSAIQLPAYSARPGHHDLDLSWTGFCTECLCKIANSENVDLYGVPQEELENAKIRYAPESFKTDEDFGQDIQRRKSPMASRSPSPPCYPSTA